MLKSGYSLDHIGVAVTSLKEGKAFYEALGFKSMYEETVTTEKVKVGMFKLDNQCQIELLEATSADSPVAKFIDKRGPGIHHICLRVENLREVLSQLKSRGVRLINEEPKPGAHGCQVAFVHPSAAGGVLVELSQPPAEGEAK